MHALWPSLTAAMPRKALRKQNGAPLHLLCQTAIRNSAGQNTVSYSGRCRRTQQITEKRAAAYNRVHWPVARVHRVQKQSLQFLPRPTHDPCDCRIRVHRVHSRPAHPFLPRTLGCKDRRSRVHSAYNPRTAKSDGRATPNSTRNRAKSTHRQTECAQVWTIKTRNDFS